MDKVSQLIDWLEKAASTPRRALLVLLVVAAVTYLPGYVRLPAVDRTEVIWAETTRDMVARGAFVDPRYEGVVHQFRPIGTYWAQGLFATLAGEGNARDIRVYRIPGLLAVAASVLAVYWLASPLIGTWAAFLSAALFGVAPLTVLLSQLAIADGLALLPAVVAMLALLRIYCSGETEDTRRLVLLFWGAVGCGMLVNALQTPILVLATLIALYVFDRDTGWLRRLNVAAGLPIALGIAAPWIYVRAHQDGVPFSGLEFGKFLAALGGAQDMKLRAFPGTFVLAAVLGFLPGTALLYPALKRLWNERGDKLARFLLAWVIGYIFYLELVSSKPGTYTVQVMFPAFAMAVALLVSAPRREAGLPAGHAILAPPLAALFAISLFVCVYVWVDEDPSIVLMILIAVVAALFFVSAAAARSGDLKRWAVLGTAALSAFAITLLGGTFPGLAKIWPARQIQRALEGCEPGPVAVLGFREPSARFVLRSRPEIIEPEALRTALVELRPAYIVGESRDTHVKALNRFQYRRLKPVACVEAYNAMRGCPLYFSIISTGDTTGCTRRESFPCNEDFEAHSAAVRQNPSCD